MKILLTGFDPFDGASINPSYEAVKKVKVKNPEIELFTREIPTIFNESIEVLDTLIEEIQPDIVICTGQAGGRSGISIERVGINIIDARIADNAGNQFIDQEIEHSGENAYFSTLPIKAVVRDLKAQNIPAIVSNTAGTFVCNHILYGLLYLAEIKYPGLKGGFIHVPFLPEQVLDKPQVPSMSLANISEALRIIVETSASTDKDIKMESGSIC